VTFWFELEVKGAKLSSEFLRASVVTVRREDSEFWNEDTVARLEAATETHSAALHTCKENSESFMARMQAFKQSTDAKQPTALSFDQLTEAKQQAER
jgi:hypothetical protein